MTLNEAWVATKSAMKQAEEVLPNRPRKANQPGITQLTRQLIDERTVARLRNDLLEERRLHKEIRRQAKSDRTEWLEALLAEGRWQEI